MRAIVCSRHACAILRTPCGSVCLCFYLRPGIITLSLLSFVNACFCFAGEGALLLGSTLATGIAESAGESAGKLVPAGAISGSSAVHGGIIFAGVYMLLMATFGFTAGFCKKPWAATAFYVMTVIDVVLGIAIAVIMSFMVGIVALITQIPIFFVNVYLCLVANSYRLELIEAASGDYDLGGSGASRPKDPEVRSGSSGGDFGVTAADVRVDSGARVPQVAIDDDEDGDISRGNGQRV